MTPSATSSSRASAAPSALCHCASFLKGFLKVSTKGARGRSSGTLCSMKSSAVAGGWFMSHTYSPKRTSASVAMTSPAS